MPACTITVRSRYLNTAAPLIIYVKSNKEFPCSSESTSNVCAQRGSQAAALYFDDAYALAFKEPYATSKVLLKAGVGTFGTLEAKYEFGGRLSYEFGGSAFSTLLGSFVPSSEPNTIRAADSGGVRETFSVSGVTLGGGTMTLTNVSPLPTQLNISDVTILNTNKDPQWLGLTMRAGAGAHLDISLEDMLVDADQGRALLIENEFSTILSIVQNKIRYQGLHIGQYLNQILLTGTGTINNRLDSIDVQFPDKDPENPVTPPGSAIDIRVTGEGVLNRVLTYNTASTDSATVVSKLATAGTTTLNETNSVRTTTRGTVGTEAYSGSSKTDSQSNGTRAAQLLPTTWPMTTFSLSDTAKAIRKKRDCSHTSRVVGGGPAHLVQIGDNTEYDSQQNNATRTNVGDCVLLQRNLTENGKCTVRQDGMIHKALQSEGNNNTSTSEKITANDLAAFRSTVANNSYFVEWGTIIHHVFSGTSQAVLTSSNSEKVLGTVLNPSPQSAILRKVIGDAKYKRTMMGNTQRYFTLFAGSAVNYESSDNAEFSCRSQNNESAVEGGAGLYMLNSNDASQANFSMAQSQVAVPPFGTRDLDSPFGTSRVPTAPAISQMASGSAAQKLTIDSTGVTAAQPLSTTLFDQAQATQAIKGSNFLWDEPSSAPMDALNLAGQATATRQFGQNSWSGTTAQGTPLRSLILKDSSNLSSQHISETFTQRGGGDVLSEALSDDSQHTQTLATIIAEAAQGTFHKVACTGRAASTTVASSIRSKSVQAFDLANAGPSPRLSYTVNEAQLNPSIEPFGGEPLDFISAKNGIDPTAGDAGSLHVNLSSISATADPLANKALINLQNEHPSIEKLICKISASSLRNDGITSDHHSILARNAKVVASTSSLGSNIGSCVKAIASQVVHSAMLMESGPGEAALDLLEGATQSLSASSIKADSLFARMDVSSTIDSSALSAKASLLAEGGTWNYSPNGNYPQGTTVAGTTLVEQAAAPKIAL